jgi:auxin efflux carrier family protein
MASTGLLTTFLAAIQASLSVLLVVFYGVLMARFSLLDSRAGKTISKVCVKVFLPALLFTKIGSELHAGSAHRYLVILVWALACHAFSFLIGIVAHFAFGFPDWITAAIMFNNTTSYPLLLIQSLDQTGILERLVAGDETTREAIERAKSYFLVFATISSCLTFAVGPRLIDSEHAEDESEGKQNVDEDEGSAVQNQNEDEDINEQTGLLDPHGRHGSVVSVSFFPSSRPEYTTYTQRRPAYIPKRKWIDVHSRTKWWLLFLYDFLNAPLLGAVLGAIVGLASPLHRAFFNSTYDGGWFTAWLTSSLSNIGAIFVPLPLVVAGVSLFTSWRKAKEMDSDNPDGTTEEQTSWLATTFILVVRFVLWPVISIAVIYGLAKKTELVGSDPMLWFTLMLMPVSITHFFCIAQLNSKQTGPSAMKLITMVQVSGAGDREEGKIAKLLTVGRTVINMFKLIILTRLTGFICGISHTSFYGCWEFTC